MQSWTIASHFLFWLLLTVNTWVNCQNPTNTRPNPPRDFNFDVSEGIGRSGKDCKRLLTRTLDSRARELQDELIGKRTARIGSVCDYGAWKTLRETFVDDEWNGLTHNFVRHLETQIGKIKAEVHTFEDLCIGCEDEPLLECYPSPAGQTEKGLCHCWRKYLRAETTDLFEDKGTNEICVIKSGDRCNILSEVACLSGYYCDNDSHTCRCAEQDHEAHDPDCQFEEFEDVHENENGTQPRFNSVHLLHVMLCSLIILFIFGR